MRKCLSIKPEIAVNPVHGVKLVEGQNGCDGVPYIDVFKYYLKYI